MALLIRNVRDIFLVLLGAALTGAGFNAFLIPHQVLSGGVSGISMLIGYMTGNDISWLYFALNAPLFIWGWFAIGKRFVVLSFICVVITVAAMQVIPSVQFNQDPLIASVAGGVLVGLGAGVCFRAGGSTGGFDIIGSIITRKRDFPLGVLLFGLNGFVILALGLSLKNWDLALYSMISIFVTGKIIDVVHVRHFKVTAFIITAHKDEMLKQLLNVRRGVTVIKTQGAYTKSENHMLMTVVTRYELSELKKYVRETDPHAFVNIVETASVMGLFRKE